MCFKLSSSAGGGVGSYNVSSYFELYIRDDVGAELLGLEGELFSPIIILAVNFNNNAINYSGARKSIRVRQTVRDGWVRLEIIDSGDGIPSEQLPLIWDRYYRVDKNHKRETVGTGLGLSIVKMVLQLHGAHYGVESAVGVGSNFWFELPEAQ